MMTDPIADMLTRIRNAIMARKKRVSIPASKLKLAIARILFEEGYIANYEYIEDNKQGIINITLKWVDGESAISGLERVSKPGRRVYVGWREIPVVKSGFGIAILSTSRGVLSDREAKRKKVGGELLCKIW
ncbi:30S ribosomal protein S8 [bacterium]|nr:MAG: 30S ribosomal protein S8 [bacterium]RKZ27253.1 MAG: 30S ribosomal protein S8 [bacterium]